MTTESLESNPSGLSAAQKSPFKSAAYWIGIMGRLSILFGLLGCLSFINGNIAAAIGGVVGIVIGVLSLKTAASFRRISDNAGTGIDGVVHAVTNLANLYRFQVILIAAGCGLSIVAFLFALGSFYVA